MTSFRFSALLLCTVLLCAGSASGAGLPPVAETSGSQRQGTFIWFDLLTHDADKARTYYQKLFGWEISAAEGFPGYDLISNQRLMIGGIARVSAAEQPAWLGSLSVNDVNQAVDRVEQLGGRVLEAAQEVGNRGIMALVEDNAGAAFVLLDTGSRDPKFRPIQTGDWLWIDLFITNPTDSGSFYEGLAGLRLNAFKDRNGNDVGVFMSGDTARSGVVRIPWKHIDPAWLPYIRVDDVAATIERSAQLGGRVFFKFDDGAIILDPTGAAFGIQQVSNRGG